MKARPIPRRARSGQSLIESCVVITVVSLICFGVVQLARLYAAKAVLTYAAAAGARAEMVGFNDFMVHKVVRAASIPNAGRMTNPDPDAYSGGVLWGEVRPGAAFDLALHAGQPYSPEYEIELSRIPNYLYATRWGELAGILDYERWDDVHHVQGSSSTDYVMMRSYQHYPLLFPFVRSFYAADEVRLESDGSDTGDSVTRERHYPLYLEDE